MTASSHRQRDAERHGERTPEGTGRREHPIREVLNGELRIEGAEDDETPTHAMTRNPGSEIHHATRTHGGDDCVTP